MNPIGTRTWVGFTRSFAKAFGFSFGSKGSWAAGPETGAASAVGLLRFAIISPVFHHSVVFWCRTEPSHVFILRRAVLLCRGWSQEFLQASGFSGLAVGGVRLQDCKGAQLGVQFCGRVGLQGTRLNLISVMSTACEAQLYQLHCEELELNGGLPCRLVFPHLGLAELNQLPRSWILYYRQSC